MPRNATPTLTMSHPASAPAVDEPDRPRGDRGTARRSRAPAAAAAGALEADPHRADELLAALADEAIDQMFAQQVLPRPARAGPAAAARLESPQVDLGEAVRLTPQEQAALAEELEETASPRSEALGGVGDSLAAMPTDEELDALLRAEFDEVPSHAADGARIAAELAAEMDLDDAPAASAIAPVESLAAAAHEAAGVEDDGGIVADAALEARDGVNRVEPEAGDTRPEQPAPLVAIVPAAPAMPPAAAPASAEPAARAARRSGRPWWVAPLVWINAPLLRAPATAREAVGKVALVTLLNAVAVLVYTLIIRR